MTVGTSKAVGVDSGLSCCVGSGDEGEATAATPPLASPHSICRSNVFRRQPASRAPILPTAPRPAPADNQTRQGSRRQRYKSRCRSPVAGPLPDEVQRCAVQASACRCRRRVERLSLRFLWPPVRRRLASRRRPGSLVLVSVGTANGAGVSASSTIASSGPKQFVDTSAGACASRSSGAESLGHGRPALGHRRPCRSSPQPVRRRVRRNAAPSGGSRPTAAATITGRQPQVKALPATKESSSSPGSMP